MGVVDASAVMKVLIVDDEPGVLVALGRVLRGGGKGDWEVATATSGMQALAMLDLGPVDVVVSDMSMPEMDGVELLSRVRARWPDTVRLVVSGGCQQDLAVRVASLAHQFHEKPVAPRELVAEIRAIASRRRELPPSVLRGLIGGVGDLPGAPQVYLGLKAAMQDARLHVDAVVAMVGRDPGLTAKVLQMAGSTFFTNGHPVQDLRTAIARLGLQLIAALALAASALRVDPTSGLDQHALIEHAIAAAAAARRAVTDPALAEDAFVAALLADVGLAALGCWAPDRVREVRQVVARTGAPWSDVEQELLGVTHAALGAYLLGLWRLPEPIVQAVATHHAASSDPLATELARVVREATCGSPLSTS